MVVIKDKSDGYVYGEIVANHGLTLDEAMEILGMEMTDKTLVDENDLGYEYEGRTFYYDDLEMEYID